MKRTFRTFAFAIVLVLLASMTGLAAPQEQTAQDLPQVAEPCEVSQVITSKAGIPRLTAEETRERALSGQALLVCAYPEGKKFRKFALEGALSLTALEELTPSLPEGQEIVFYCACRGSGKALDQAVLYARQGFPTRIMEGGVRSWTRAGYPNCFER